MTNWEASPKLVDEYYIYVEIMEDVKLFKLHFSFWNPIIPILVIGAFLGCTITSLISPGIVFGSLTNGPGKGNLQGSAIYEGVNMKGLYTSLIRNKPAFVSFPDNYYDDSFKLIKAAGMNHIRYVFYWEAFENDPVSFLDELQSVASMADKWGLQVIYDNHQYRTSSWLDPLKGSGFPSSLFNDNASYPYGSGGVPSNVSAFKWWTDWWNRSINDNRGVDGWTLQHDFLKKVIETVDNHTSTLGYEILNEPQVHTADQWAKIGKFNSFMNNELRKLTNKTLVFDMAIPLEFNNTKLNMTSENIAQMLPQDKNDVIFKISLYGVPIAGSYQEQKLRLLAGVANLTGIPLYIGEWNDVSPEERSNNNQKLNQAFSDLNQTDANIMTRIFKEIGVWGWAFWNWNYLHDSTPDFNLIVVTKNGDMQTTKYFDILKNAVANS